MSHLYAVIDTETTGLHDFSKPADDPSQPRLASYAMLVVDADMQVVSDLSLSTLIKPDGWQIEPGAAAVNGLTVERCEAEGIPLSVVLDHYAAIITAGRVAAAYNAQFDLKMMRGELRRAGRDDMFERTPNVCLMRACHALGVPKADPGKRGYPKLSDAWTHFHPELPQPTAHEAGGDALAALHILRHLHRLGALPEPAVHYAKNRE